MPEKIAGLVRINKLCAILLMEANFNMHNKMIFGNRIMEKAKSKYLYTIVIGFGKFKYNWLPMGPKYSLDISQEVKDNVL